MHRFRDRTTYWSKIAEKRTPLSFDTFLGVTHCEFFDKSYLPESRVMGAIRWYTFHDSAFALLGTILAGVWRTDRQTRSRRKDRALHSVARAKTVCLSVLSKIYRVNQPI